MATKIISNPKDRLLKIIAAKSVILGESCENIVTPENTKGMDFRKWKLLKEFSVAGKIFASSTLVRGKVYFGATDRRVYEVNPKTLEITGSIQFSERITNAIRYSPQQKTFFALACDNQLFSFLKIQ